LPRDGLSQYAPPPGTNGITNYTIESTKYNGFVADITADQNNPRPIVAGGTGANNAQQAMLNLSGEIAGQVVTNYDSFPFAAGSFYSAPGATSAPDATYYYIGICYMDTPAGLITLEARRATGNPAVIGPKFVRTKDGAGWSAWYQQAGSVADLDAAYVNVAGDTMSGPLNITGYLANNLAWGASGLQSTLSNDSNGTPSLNFFGRGGTGLTFSTDAGAASIIQASGGGIAFKTVPANSTNVAATLAATVSSTGNFTAGAGGATGTYYFGNSGTKSLSFDGSNFTLNGGPLTINGAALLANCPVYSATTATAGVFEFGTSGTKYLAFDGTSFALVGGGGLSVDASITSKPSATTGTYYFGNSGTKSLNYDGTNFNLVGGQLIVPGNINNAGVPKAGALIDNAGGRGFSFGVASVSDSGIGFCDVSYTAGYANPCPSASVAGLSTNVACNVGNVQVNQNRIHCITATTAALTDPQYYSLIVMGT
jgi:hypothetical protein